MRPGNGQEVGRSPERQDYLITYIPSMSRLSLFSALGNFFGAFTIYRNERDIREIENQQFDDSRRDLMDLSAEDSDREYPRKLRSLARGPRRRRP